MVGLTVIANIISYIDIVIKQRRDENAIKAWQTELVILLTKQE